MSAPVAIAPAFLGADRGYTQVPPEHFHLPVRALGYSLVMDYKETELGRQANSAGAVMVDGAFYCPAMPESSVSASADLRHGVIDAATDQRPHRGPDVVAPRAQARAGPRRLRALRLPGPWRLPTSVLPAAAGGSAPGHGQDPGPFRRQPTHPRSVPSPPITIAPDIGARHRQDLAFGSAQWARIYATYRNTIEGTNGYVKDPAHEALAAPARRRVRGIAAQSLFVGLLLMAANIRKIAAYRELVQAGDAHKVAARARSAAMSITEYRPPPRTDA